MRDVMNNVCRLVFGSVCLLASWAQAEDRFSAEQLAFFEKRIRPVLVEHCYECHSENAKQLKGGLRLDLRETLLRGGESGPAIVPGQPEKSLLIESIRYESLEMPPQGKLPDGVIADFAKWVALGAPDPRDEKPGEKPQSQRDDGKNHWAFQPINNPKRPAVMDRSWPRSEIDLFILHRLEQAGLQPATDADRYTWLRRVSFDLTGLPPTIDEIRNFQQESSALAYERVVDRLLASPAFGERWARHWLDLVGYADQIGTSNDLFAEHAWKYRDYVIQTFNSDKPFDRFIREQIAGDLLPFESVAERADQLIATGFLLLGDLEVVEADKAKLRVDVIDQQVDKVGKAFLGMTIACARCHDHKFDPITQRDYYAMAGFFHGTTSLYKTKRGVWSDVTAVELPETATQRAERAERTRLHAEQLAAWKTERTQAATRRDELNEQIKHQAAAAPDEEAARTKLTKHRDQLAGRIRELDKTIEHAEFFAPAVPRAYGVRDVEQPSDMRITIRGNPRSLGERVPRGFLSLATAAAIEIPQSQSGRQQLADWIAGPDNPLTARVAVNRIWQKLFGVGLVRSVDYFGRRGETPSHPELLDALALRFRENGWSQKRLIRSLVLSRVYRISSAHHAAAHEIDPNNRLLWRMNRRRLEAEALRDAMLAVSKQLQAFPGGPALPLEFPENVSNIDPQNVNPPSFRLAKWRPEQDYQRTIYLPVIRSGPQPGPAELRNVFDFTQPAVFAGERVTTAVPTQALFLMNSPVVKRHAGQLSERIQREASAEGPRLKLLWLCALNRPISAAEKQEAELFLAKAGAGGWVELCHAVLASNEFLMRL